VTIAPDGEILTRGPHVMKGYYNKPEATREAIDPEGWFHTGDIGELRDGFLAITDRKKDIIVTAGGKNIAPQPIENVLKTNKYISQAVLIGDKRKFPVVLVVPNWEQLEKWARIKNLLWTQRSQLLEMPIVHAKIEKEVYGRLEGLGEVRDAEEGGGARARLLRRAWRAHADAQGEAPRDRQDLPRRDRPVVRGRERRGVTVSRGGLQPHQPGRRQPRALRPTRARRARAPAQPSGTTACAGATTRPPARAVCTADSSRIAPSSSTAIARAAPTASGNRHPRGDRRVPAPWTTSGGGSTSCSGGTCPNASSASACRPHAPTSTANPEAVAEAQHRREVVRRHAIREVGCIGCRPGPRRRGTGPIEPQIDDAVADRILGAADGQPRVPS
jgi:hypothetical protein